MVRESQFMPMLISQPSHETWPSTKLLEFCGVCGWKWEGGWNTYKPFQQSLSLPLPLSKRSRPFKSFCKWAPCGNGLQAVNSPGSGKLTARTSLPLASTSKSHLKRMLLYMAFIRSSALPSWWPQGASPSKKQGRNIPRFQELELVCEVSWL